MSKLKSKKSWERLRAYFTWHLTPPYDKEFDRSQWWPVVVVGKQRPAPCNVMAFETIAPQPGDSILDPVSALYELARRHPLIGGLRKALGKNTAKELSPDAPQVTAVRFLLKAGLKSWPKLTKEEQREWQQSFRQMKGVDSRPESDLCVSISERTKSSLVLKQVFGKSRRKAPTKRQVELEIARAAVEAYQAGFNLFALAPELSPDKAATLLRRQLVKKESSLFRCESAARVLNPMPKKRARCDDWPRLITEFENRATAPKHGVNSQVFTRYRRALERLPFPSPQV